MENKKWIQRHLVVVILLAAFCLFAGWGISSNWDASPGNGPTSAVGTRMLNARIGKTNLGVVVHNDELVTWSLCSVYLNNLNYKDDKISDLTPGENTLLYSDFVKSDGTRFNYLLTAPTDLFIQCKDPQGTIAGEW